MKTIDRDGEGVCSSAGRTLGLGDEIFIYFQYIVSKFRLRTDGLDVSRRSGGLENLQSDHLGMGQSKDRLMTP